MVRRIAAYVWTSPNSALGLAIGIILLSFGARGRLVRGVVEVSGGLIGRLLQSRRVAFPYHAVTLGHVILATDSSAADACRAHEHVHVRQYERWGPFFLPAYFACSLWQLLRGGRCYRDNYFEREAFESSSAPRP